MGGDIQITVEPAEGPGRMPAAGSAGPAGSAKPSEIKICCVREDFQLTVEPAEGPGRMLKVTLYKQSTKLCIGSQYISDLTLLTMYHLTGLENSMRELLTRAEMESVETMLDEIRMEHAELP